MDTPRLSDVMSALLTLFGATPGLDGVTIKIGGDPSAAGDKEFVIIGHDGTLDVDGALSTMPEAGSFNSRFVTMGVEAEQQETGTVNCVVVAQGGETDDVTTRIDRAQTLLAACGTACTDLYVGDIKFDSPGAARLFTRFTGNGFAAEFVFQVTYQTPLG